jgi:hypothetical protein
MLVSMLHTSVFACGRGCTEPHNCSVNRCHQTRLRFCGVRASVLSVSLGSALSSEQYTRGGYIRTVHQSV